LREALLVGTEQTSYYPQLANQLVRQAL